VAVTACLAMTLVVSGCGGGKKVQAFQPAQVIVFGDENSAFEDSGTTLVSTAGNVALRGARYTVNLLTPIPIYCKVDPGTNSVKDCPTAQLTLPGLGVTFTDVSTVYTRSTTPLVVNTRETGYFSDATSTTVYLSTDFYFNCSPGVVNANGYVGNWVQTMAYDFSSSLSFGGVNQCPQDSGNGKSYAKWGAKVDEVEGQKNQHRGELGEGVLVAILAGQNDIMGAYDEVMATTLSRESALVRMREKGAQLARVINDVVSTGARVVYLTVPDMGKSPKAVAGNATLATDLTQAFNEGYNNLGGLVLTVVTNGHKIVKVDGFTQIHNLAASYPTTGACDPTKITMPDHTAIVASTDPNYQQALLLNCTSETIVGTSDFSAYLWADDTHLAPIGHAALAALAVSRVRDQL
jgi:outer membrane lipase/esterase